jgi:type IV pilus assembly protein PilQ
MASNRNTKQNGTRTLSTMHKAMFAALLAQLAGTSASLGHAHVPGQQVSGSLEAAAMAQEEAFFADDPQDYDGFEPEVQVATDKVRVDENQIVDLHVNDEELSNVLEMLSIQSQRNIVASKSVNARVTANLYGVTFFEALDAILNVNGFGYIQQGNFIYVYTQQELEVIAKAQRQKVSKVINLNYLNAIDAAEFVKPLLSESGQIKTNGKTPAFPTPTGPLGLDDYAGYATLVVIDFEENIAEIENLIRQLDTRPAQVLVEATILQTTLTEANAFGVDFSIIADMDFGDFVRLGGPLTAVNNMISGVSDTTRNTPLPLDGKGGAVTSNVGNTAGPGGIKLGIVKNDVAVFMRILDEVTDTTILSNPKILALNRQPSRVLVGRKVGYLSTTSTDTATTQTVEFLDTGTQLNFRPFVTSENMIRMELKPQVSEAVIRDTNDSTGNLVTIPDEITNELVTNVLVGDGQTIVLGGLFRESTQSTRRQVPFLGDIPIIGHAFRGNDDSTNRNEIIFLVTPTIVNDTTLSLTGQRTKEYIDHVRAGSREGLLFWSREKLTARMNVEAERLANEGHTEKALWKINRSLSLNHNQPEAIALRERLTGKKSQWPDRSILERVLRADTQKMVGETPAFDPDFAPSDRQFTDEMLEQANTMTIEVEAQESPVASSTVTNVDPNASASFNVNTLTPEPSDFEPSEVEPGEPEPASPEFESGPVVSPETPVESDLPVWPEPQNAPEFDPEPSPEFLNDEEPEMGEEEQFDGEQPVSGESVSVNTTPVTPAPAVAPQPLVPSTTPVPVHPDWFAEIAKNERAEAVEGDEMFADFPEDEMAEGEFVEDEVTEGEFENVPGPTWIEQNAPEHLAPATPEVEEAPAEDAKATAVGTEIARLWLGRGGMRGGAWNFFRALTLPNANSTFSEVKDTTENVEGR